MDNEYPCNSCPSSDTCDGWEAQFCCTLCHYLYDDEDGPPCDTCDPMDI